VQQESITETLIRIIIFVTLSYVEDWTEGSWAQLAGKSYLVNVSSGNSPPHMR